MGQSISEANVKELFVFSSCHYDVSDGCGCQSEIDHLPMLETLHVNNLSEYLKVMQKKLQFAIQKLDDLDWKGWVGC